MPELAPVTTAVGMAIYFYYVDFQKESKCHSTVLSILSTQVSSFETEMTENQGECILCIISLLYSIPYFIKVLLLDESGP